MEKHPIVYTGQKVITTAGNVVTVAFESCGHVFAFSRNGMFEEIKVVGDAFGGEHDQEIGLAA